MIEFYANFTQDLVARSGVEGNYLESVFIERMCEFLNDQAIISDYHIVEYKKMGGAGVAGVRLDAYYFNEETELLSLVVSDFRTSKEIETLTNTDIKKNFAQVERFLNNCIESTFYQSMEESTPGYSAAREINQRMHSISKVQFFVISNAILSKSAKEIISENTNWSYHIWDISRLSRIEQSGKSREDIVVHFEEPVPCLPAFTGSENCKSFLLALSGELVASLYEKYGERLLEQNVRTFLQFRGKVNKGMRNTVQNEPDMFFAYNNGLTTTAEGVDFDTKSNTLRSVTNLQVVNGGQTTASLFASRKKSRLDLSQVYVQVKLSVIPPEAVETVVPKISEYANTQNKVNAADFFSNRPIHLRLEEFSRRLWAPASGQQETHWFYERARGQFANASSNLTKSKQKEFLRMNPKHQMFTKTDLSKYLYSFDELPHIVSKGAQFCFAQFANKMSKEWDKNEQQFNELFFKTCIAKAIVFKSLDKQIMKQPWYGGYKANIVTYSLAKLANMVDKVGYKIDYLKIWEQQAISVAMNTQLLQIADVVNQIIQDTSLNVTQYCKQELCWQNVKAVKIKLNEKIYDDFLDYADASFQEKEAKKDQKELNNIEAVNYVFKKSGSYWNYILLWNSKVKVLSPKEVGILQFASGIPDKIPTDWQAKYLLKIESKAIDEGFAL